MTKRIVFVSLILCLTACVSILALGSAANAYLAGAPGDDNETARSIQITMQEVNGKMLFSPARIEVKKGELIKFVLRNDGALEHEFVLATKEENAGHAEAMRSAAEMEHDDQNERHVAPKQTGELVWKFSKAGEFEYACLIPGHYEAGMRGTVIVQ